MCWLLLEYVLSLLRDQLSTLSSVATYRGPVRVCQRDLNCVCLQLTDKWLSLTSLPAYCKWRNATEWPPRCLQSLCHTALETIHPLVTAVFFPQVFHGQFLTGFPCRLCWSSDAKSLCRTADGSSPQSSCQCTVPEMCKLVDRRQMPGRITSCCALCSAAGGGVFVWCVQRRAAAAPSWALKWHTDSNIEAQTDTLTFFCMSLDSDWPCKSWHKSSVSVYIQARSYFQCKQTEQCRIDEMSSLQMSLSQSSSLKCCGGRWEWPVTLHNIGCCSERPLHHNWLLLWHRQNINASGGTSSGQTVFSSLILVDEASF